MRAEIEHLARLGRECQPGPPGQPRFRHEQGVDRGLKPLVTQLPDVLESSAGRLRRWHGNVQDQVAGVLDVVLEGPRELVV